MSGKEIVIRIVIAILFGFPVWFILVAGWLQQSWLLGILGIGMLVITVIAMWPLFSEQKPED